MRLVWLFAFGVAPLVASACSSSEASSPTVPPVADAGQSTLSDGAIKDSAPSADSSTCTRAPKTGDYVRSVVVSHPSDQNGAKALDYEVLHLDADGSLTRDGARFTMGRTFDSPIIFSPDGVIGVAVQDDDGTLGIFRFDESGAPVVIEARFGKDDFYAQSAAFSPDGTRLYVTDVDVNNGGIHEVEIACNGTPTYKGKILPARGSSALSFLPDSPSRAVLTNWLGPDAGTTNDLSIIDFSSTPKHETSIPLFGDGQSTSKWLGMTPDGKLGLVPDANDYVGTNRLGVFSFDGTSLKKVSVLDLEGPSGVVVSPYGNAAIVTTAGPSVDGLHVLSIDQTKPTPVVDKGKLTALAGPKPQLPTGPVVLTRGGLKGLVLISEVEGVRRVRFEADGSVVDLGIFTFQGGLEASVGAVGVQP